MAVAALAVVSALLALPTPGAGQQEGQEADTVVTPVIPQAASQDSLRMGPSPGGAFLRGVLLPGWGHTASGSLSRGAFYFGVESASVWMLFKTVRKLGAVRDRVDFWETQVTARLMASGVTDPVLIAEGVDADPDVARTRNLAAGREEQREDWLAASIFFLLLSGVDAFVSAHLQDFPEPLTVGTGPTGEGLEVGMRIPVDWFDGR